MVTSLAPGYKQDAASPRWQLLAWRPLWLKRVFAVPLVASERSTRFTFCVSSVIAFSPLAV